MEFKNHQEAWERASNHALRVGEHISAIVGAVEAETTASRILVQELLPKQVGTLSVYSKIRDSASKGNEIAEQDWSELFAKISELGKMILDLRDEVEEQSVPYTLLHGLGQNFEKFCQVIECLKFAHHELPQQETPVGDSADS